MIHAFATFAVFAAVVTITPGVDTMLVVRTSAVAGRRAGLAAAVGIVLGCLVWASLSALGVTALLTASRLAFEVLRAAGVAYLLYLGVRALWQARRPAVPDPGAGPPIGPGVAAAQAPSAAAGPVPPPGSALVAARTGLTTNLLNPKVGVFYLSVMPAFLPAEIPALAGALGLGAIHAVEGLVWLSALVFAVGRARVWLARPAVARRLEQLTGVVFVAFGLRLALERAPG